MSDRKRIDLGGEGDLFFLLLRILNDKDECGGDDESCPHHRRVIADFRAKDDDEAKGIVLRTIQSEMAGEAEGAYFIDMTLPRNEPGGPEANTDRMFRTKDTYSDRRILAVTDPNEAIVQGYGPKVAAQLTA